MKSQKWYDIPGPGYLRDCDTYPCSLSATASYGGSLNTDKYMISHRFLSLELLDGVLQLPHVGLSGRKLYFCLSFAAISSYLYKLTKREKIP